MKKMWSFLSEHGVSTTMLVILLALTIFISTTISTKEIAQLVENTSTSVIQKNEKIITINRKLSNEEYQDFLAHYYENQANWLNFWLTLLALMTALVGIGVPFVLGYSYREKIKEMSSEFSKKIMEMEHEFEKKNAEVDSIIQISDASIISLKEEVKEIRSQAEKTKNHIEKTLNEQMKKFRIEMNNIESDVKKTTIINNLKALVDSAEHNRNIGKDDLAFEEYSKIINNVEKISNEYKDDKKFIEEINYIVGNILFSRALIYFYDKKEYQNAITDIEKGIKIGYATPTDYQLLLESYIFSNDFGKGIEVLENIEKFYRKDIPSAVFKILESSEQPQAKELLDKINKKIIDYGNNRI